MRCYGQCGSNDYGNYSGNSCNMRYDIHSYEISGRQFCQEFCVLHYNSLCVNFRPYICHGQISLRDAFFSFLPTVGPPPQNIHKVLISVAVVDDRVFIEVHSATVSLMTGKGEYNRFSSIFILTKFVIFGTFLSQSCKYATTVIPLFKINFTVVKC